MGGGLGVAGWGRERRGGEGGKGERIVEGGESFEVGRRAESWRDSGVRGSIDVVGRFQCFRGAERFRRVGLVVSGEGGFEGRFEGTWV